MQTPHHDLFAFFDAVQQSFLPYGPNKSPGSYPPYNIIRTSADEYRIEIACAGFLVDELNIEQEGSELTISGQKPKVSPLVDKEVDGDYPQYIYKGLAERSFKQVVRLPETGIVDKVTYQDGILSVVIVTDRPSKRKIIINDPAQGPKKRQALRESE